MPYQSLDTEKLVATVSRLRDRVHERFPDRGLAEVCEELVGLASSGGASEETLDALRQVVEGFDRLRYTPDGGSADETGRLIAVISLEPMNRNRARLRRAFG